MQAETERCRARLLEVRVFQAGGLLMATEGLRIKRDKRRTTESADSVDLDEVAKAAHKVQVGFNKISINWASTWLRPRVSTN